MLHSTLRQLRARSLAKNTTTPLTIRSVAELSAEIVRLAEGGSMTRYFREEHSGSVRRLLKEANGDRHALSKLIGVVPACRRGNRLTDYMPRDADQKLGQSGGKGGYTNLSPNAKDTAPIAIDTFPSGHVFHRMTFKKQAHLLTSIYKVPGQRHQGQRQGPHRQSRLVLWLLRFVGRNI